MEDLLKTVDVLKDCFKKYILKSILEQARVSSRRIIVDYEYILTWECETEELYDKLLNFFDHTVSGVTKRFFHVNRLKQTKSMTYIFYSALDNPHDAIKELVERL